MTPASPTSPNVLFLEDEATLIIGSPDGSAPINGGVFLVKPSAAAGGGAYGIAVQWLRNGSDAIWDPELGYDRVGQPSTLGLPRGASVRGPSYVTTRTSHRNFTHSYCNTHSAHVCARLYIYTHIYLYIGGWGVSPTGKSFCVVRACARSL